MCDDEGEDRDLLHLGCVKRVGSFGEEYNLEFIDESAESLVEEQTTESFIDSLVNSLSRKEKVSLLKGKVVFSCTHLNNRYFR